MAVVSYAGRATESNKYRSPLPDSHGTLGRFGNSVPKRIGILLLITAQAISQNPLMAMLRAFVRNKHLIKQLTQRDITARYRGSALGLAWSFFNPLVMLAVYTVVFSVVFEARWGAGDGSKTEFALVLFIGMIVHRLLADSMNQSVNLIIRHTSYVKKVVFPLEVLPYIQMGGVLFHTLTSLAVWLVFYALTNLSVQWTVIFLPVVLLPLVIFSLGVSWLLASLGAYLRDVSQIIGVLTTILLFLSPVFYPASRLPEPYSTLIYINPLTFFIEESRNVLMWGNTPDINALALAYLVSLLVAVAGFWLFQKTRKGFADVL